MKSALLPRFLEKLQTEFKTMGSNLNAGLIPAGSQLAPVETASFLQSRDTSLDLKTLKNTSAGNGELRLAEQLFSESEIDDLLTGGSVVLLTDQYAPVDQMLAPVFRGEEKVSSQKTGAW